MYQTCSQSKWFSFKVHETDKILQFLGPEIMDPRRGQNLQVYGPRIVGLLKNIGKVGSGSASF